MLPAGAGPRHEAFRELVELADLAARSGWRLDAPAHGAGEVGWERGPNRVAVEVTRAGRLRRCGFGVQTLPDPFDDPNFYGGAELAEPEPTFTMLFWVNRRDAGPLGLAGLARRWFCAPATIEIGDRVLFDGQWCPVTTLAAGHVTALFERRGRRLPVHIGRHEIEGRKKQS